MRRFRPWLLLAALAAALLAPAAPAAGAEPGLQVMVNGQVLNLDTPAFIENGRTLVPLRAIFEALGARIEWNGATRTVTGTRGSRTVVLTVDSDQARVDGQEVRLAVPAKIRGGRTFVPLRFVAEALGASVDFDGETRTVLVVDLAYTGAGAHAGLLQKMALYRAAPDGDFQASMGVGPVEAGSPQGMTGTVTGQVRGADAYFKLTQNLNYMGYKINQTSELAVRGGQVYQRAAGEPAWKALGPGAARLGRLDLPGGLDPSRPLATPLIGAIQSVVPGAPVTLEGQEYQEYTLTFDPARLQGYFGDLARGFGTNLEGVTWDTLQARVLVRTSDGFTRRMELRVTWRIAQPGGASAGWQLTMASEWQPAGGAIAWPPDLPN